MNFKNKSKIIYLLLVVLNTPIIGLYSYNTYYKPNIDIVVPVYERVVVLKYGKIDSTSNLDKRKKIKQDYSALEKQFKDHINHNTDYGLKIATTKHKEIYKMPTEFISVSFEALNEFKLFFMNKCSEIVYDLYNLLQLNSSDDFVELINTKINNEDLILDTNINNLLLTEITYIKQYKISTKIYKKID